MPCGTPESHRELVDGGRIGTRNRDGRAGLILSHQPLSGIDSIGASSCAKLIQRDRCGFEFLRRPWSRISGVREHAGRGRQEFPPGLPPAAETPCTVDRDTSHEAPLLFVLALDTELPIRLLRRHAIRFPINAGGMNQANSQNAAFL